MQSRGLKLRQAIHEDVLKDPEARIMLDTLDPKDLDRFGRAAANILSSWFELTQSRRVVLAQLEKRALTKGEHQYHAFKLQETVRRNLKDIGVLYGLPVLLEVTGLNTVYSRLFIEHMLKPQKTDKGTHILDTRLLHDFRDTVAESCQSYGLSKEAVGWVCESWDQFPEAEVPVQVIAPQDNLKPPIFLEPGPGPDLWEPRKPDIGNNDSSTGAPSGPGGGNSGGMGGFSMPICKGVSLIFTEMLSTIATVMTTAVKAEMKYGLIAPDGTIIINVASPIVHRKATRGMSAADAATAGSGAICVGSLIGLTMGNATGLTAVGSCFGYGLGLFSNWGGVFGGWIYDIVHAVENEIKSQGNKFVDP